MKLNKLQEKGITLIALVITIIILLILAGITISIVFNDGIIENSQKAADSYRYQQAREKLESAILDYSFSKMTGEDIEFEDVIKKIEGTINNHDEEKGEYDITIDGFDFTVDDETLEIKGSKEGTIPGETETPKKTEYTLSISAEANGTVDGDSGTKTIGQSCTVSAIPDTGYEFDGWYENGIKVHNEKIYTFYMPEKNYNLVAKFAKVLPFGTYVTVLDKGYYLLNESRSNEDKLSLLLDNYLTAAEMSDLTGTNIPYNRIQFSSTNYWRNIPGITYSFDLNEVPDLATGEKDVMKIAIRYGEKIKELLGTDVKGRLLNLNEVNIYFNKYPSWMFSYEYWTGRALENNLVTVILAPGGYSSNFYEYNREYYVRPVIEISRSYVSISE